MCGILGFNWEDKVLALELSNNLKHRGPDQDGFYFDNGLSLAHRRLSIVDLSENGKQPMISDDNNFVIVFNGEIFNFLDIKDDLIKKGYVFKSTSDTEVLLNGFREYGYDILEKLNGQFAFAIYDKKKKEIFLARDRVGINPLYYYFKDGKFIFGSELKVVLDSGVKKEIDEFSLKYFFLYGYTPKEKTILKDTYKLSAGCYMVFDLEKQEIREKKKYWNFEISNTITDERQACDLIIKQLEKSVKDRMVADVPVGAFLSGGVDSSAVVAMMSRYTKQVDTFSVKFDHAEYDESKYADIISKKFNTNHHVIEFSARDVRELIKKLPEHYDEPFADHSMIPTFLVSYVARQNVTVSLSGDGGDELFGGYPSYLRYKTIMWQRLIPRFKFYFWEKILNLSKSEKLVKLKKFVRIGKLKKELRFAKFRSFLYEDEFKKMFNDDLIPYYSEYANGYFRDNYLEEAINTDANNYMVDDILTKVDRASLGNSLESRPPILDHEMVELAMKIDVKLKIKNKETKYIFKKALEGILPDEILYRKKQGFGVPLKYYLRGELKDLVEKYVINYDKHSLYKKDIIDEVKRVIESDNWGKDYSRIIWSIMMFNMWYDRWFLNN